MLTYFDSAVRMTENNSFDESVEAKPIGKQDLCPLKFAC